MVTTQTSENHVEFVFHRHTQVRTVFFSSLNWSNNWIWQQTTCSQAITILSYASPPWIISVIIYSMNGSDDFFLLYKLNIHRSEVIARTALVLTPEQYTHKLQEFILHPILALASNISSKKIKTNELPMCVSSECNELRKLSAHAQPAYQSIPFNF